MLRNREAQPQPKTSCGDCLSNHAEWTRSAVSGEVSFIWSSTRQGIVHKDTIQKLKHIEKLPTQMQIRREPEA
jgi:hypothetical protein